MSGRWAGRGVRASRSCAKSHFFISAKQKETRRTVAYETKSASTSKKVNVACHARDSVGTSGMRTSNVQH